MKPINARRFEIELNDIENYVRCIEACVCSGMQHADEPKSEEYYYGIYKIDVLLTPIIDQIYKLRDKVKKENAYHANEQA
jgi:hypothetical protein